ncbi:MAG: XRE family transcriptional regulator, partial [Pseudonocardiales bacterium]|nr:XRE family transcriptional regulator [Pseudonocardiales bacterium]
DLGPGTLEQLEELVDQLGREYFAVPPVTFREDVLSWRRYVARLLDSKLILREPGDWLSACAAVNG